MAAGEPMPVLFPIFMVVWVVLGVIGGLVFHVSRDAARKERLHPPFVIGTGVLFGGLVLVTGPRDAFQLLMLPVVGLITWMNLRMTWFCHQCGRTVYQVVGFRRAQYCSYCGAPVTDR